MLTTSALALVLMVLAIDTPPESAVRSCEQKAQTDAGVPPVSPRSHLSAAAPGNDADQRRRPDETQRDIEAALARPRSSADARDQYRVAFEACLRARAR